MRTLLSHTHMSIIQSSFQSNHFSIHCISIYMYLSSHILFQLSYNPLAMFPQSFYIHGFLLLSSTLLCCMFIKMFRIFALSLTFPYVCINLCTYIISIMCISMYNLHDMILLVRMCLYVYVNVYYLYLSILCVCIISVHFILIYGGLY